VAVFSLAILTLYTDAVRLPLLDSIPLWRQRKETGESRIGNLSTGAE